MTERIPRNLWATRGWSLAAKLDFYSMPEPNSGCVLWLGNLNRNGYGQIYWGGTNTSAHRAAWIAANGPVPVGLCVCHTCDVRSCINVAHLWLGTNTENTADKTVKGRAARLFGELNRSAKLTQRDADEIRGMPGKHEDIAAAFRVNRTVVGKIKRGEIWRTEAVPIAMPTRREIEGRPPQACARLP